MRTTLTIDDDVAAKLEAERIRRGKSLKETVNAALRRGLEAPPPEELAALFRVEARPMGLRPGISLDDVAGLLDELDGPHPPMILVDANLLLYAYDSQSAHHERARRWFERSIAAGAPLRFSLVTLLAFVRIATDRRVFQVPLSAKEACEIVEEWLALPSLGMLHPGPRTWRILADLCATGQASGPLVMDAHLAALALEHGATVATTDRDFSRFDGIRVENPLET